MKAKWAEAVGHRNLIQTYLKVGNHQMVEEHQIKMEKLKLEFWEMFKTKYPRFRNPRNMGAVLIYNSYEDFVIEVIQ